jgi:DAACS family dicarboxylate/amino acid:cation (Na+ or H+) symporter
MLLGIGLGAGLGIAANTWARDALWLKRVVDYVTYPAGQIFLRLLFMLVVPVVFAALVMGVSELDLKHLGRIGLKTLVYTVVVSVVAVAIGLFLVNVVAPGRGVTISLADQATKPGAIEAVTAPANTSAVALLIGIVPDNPVEAAATSDMLGLITFSLIFGIGIALTKTEPAERLKEAIAGLFDVSMRLIEGVLRFAPYGVGALMFTMTSQLGVTLLGKLAAYVLVVLGALATHQLVVYSLSVKLLGGMSPLRFFRGIRLAMATAFATASSNATLPTALRVAEEELHLPPHVSRFVLTAGATMNQNGTALFEGVTVLFLAQLYGVELSLGQQALVMAICVLGGIGTAGVPAGSLPVIAMILGLLGIPVEGLGLILGVDRFLDMCRTVLNVSGDLAAAVVVSRGEPAEPPPSDPAFRDPASRDPAPSDPAVPLPSDP